MPLETDLTTPLAYFLANSNLGDITDIIGFVRGDHIRSQTGIRMLAPYQPGKIPVVLVHGLLSSPLTWAPVMNDLQADPVLRERYQFWYYYYPTGAPYLASAAELRRQLEQLRQEVDPRHQDPALDNMVFVGHSMGGLISKLMTMDSDDDFWHLVSDEPIDRLKMPENARTELQQTFLFPAGKLRDALHFHRHAAPRLETESVAAGPTGRASGADAARSDDGEPGSHQGQSGPATLLNDASPADQRRSAGAGVAGAAS